MSTNSARLALIKNTTADPYRVSDYTANWEKLDQHPGRFICTSTTRPATWGAPQEGMHIYEKDTKLSWVWTGAVFERTGPRGKLGATARTADIATTLTNYVVAVQTSVIVPAGGRDVQIIAEVPKADSTGGVVFLALVRDSTLLTEWTMTGETGSTVATTQPKAAPYTFRDPAPLPGAHAYALQFAVPGAFPGTASLRAATTRPLQITAVEI